MRILGKATTATHGDAQLLVYARHDDTQLLLLSCARTAALMKTASAVAYHRIIDMADDGWQMIDIE
jgi:hypothetical protein